MEALAEAEAAALNRSTRRPAFELKGVMTSLAVMRLGTADLGLIDRQLRVKVAQLPQFFQDAPVVLDFGALPDAGNAFPLAALVVLLRSYRLIPVAITNGGDRARALATAAGLGHMQDRGRGNSAPASATPPAEAVEITAAAARGVESAATTAGRGRARVDVDGEHHAEHAAEQRAAAARTPAPEAGSHARPTLVVRQAVRAGQVIYAQRSDLVVLAPVNAGAEVVADGHLHIYSSLRGRAVAGAQGFSEARIFCQKLEAELVAIAGAYVMAEHIPVDRRGRSVQVYLEGGECRIVPL